MANTTWRARPWAVLALMSPVVAVAVTASAATAQVRGEVSIETRIFPYGGLYGGQDQYAGSLKLNPRYDRTWARGRQLVSVEMFGRFDQRDGQRTHFDVRQLSWEMAAESWEVRAGIRRVFWGVTESQHLVDVINQTDLVEDPDGEDKLGQPMVNLALIRSWGALDFFVLPGFRERSFAGQDGRLRAGVPVETDLATYESGAGRGHVDWAARWSHSVGAWDFGLSHFSGTGREPRLVPVTTDGGALAIAPHYEQIDQTGLDVQFTTGAWLGKLETIVRNDSEGRFAALTAGFEYTIGGAFGTAADLGLLGEYLWDERGSAATSPFEDDVFLGARLALNDVQSTQLLGGAIVDRRGGGALFTLEASRRLGDTWSASVRGLAFTGTRSGRPLHVMRRDDFVEIGITRHF